MKKLTRSSRYMIFVSVFLVVINALLGFLLTKQSDLAIRTLIHDRMLDISNTAAAMIDGDVLEKVGEDNLDCPECLKIYETLAYFQNNIELEYIYCVKDRGDGTFIFTIDPTVDDPGEYGEEIVCTDALLQASRGVATVDDVPYVDKWGRFYSAYSPVLDSAGNVAGIVAVDFSADWYDRQISNLVRITAVVIVVAFCISVAIIIFIAARYRKRFKTVYKEMNALSDEIETLVKEVSIDSYWYEEQTAKISEKTSNDEIEVIAIKIRNLQNRLEEQIGYVRSLAYIDGLTGLENRTAYMEQVKCIEEKIASDNAAFSVIVCDINQLKLINDDYGHEEGDKVITLISGTIRDIFPNEKIYRIGGDEFAVILKGKDYENRHELFEELKETFRKIWTEKENDPTHRFSGSVGMADSTHCRSTRETIKTADENMYEDKKLFKEKNGSYR